MKNRCSINTTEDCLQPAVSSLGEMLGSMNVVGYDDGRSFEVIAFFYLVFQMGFSKEQ